MRASAASIRGWEWWPCSKGTRPSKERPMEALLKRLDALESQHKAVQRQLRLWRGTAGIVVVAALLCLGALPSQTAPAPDLASRVSALESLLQHFSRSGNDVFITGANLHLRNGMGGTDSVNGVGNLIVGYNEEKGTE